MSKPRFEPQSWERFQETGLLWLINSMLHVFGWAWVLVYDEDGHCIGAYPAHTTGVTGFDRRVELEAKANLINHVIMDQQRLFTNLGECSAQLEEENE